VKDVIKDVIAVVFLVVACLLFLAFLAIDPALQRVRRYKLPTGKIVACRSLEETSKGNYVLDGCEDGIKYYTNGTIEELP
jgi:hypothetical protein